MVITGERKLCMVPGPVEFDEKVLAAMATPSVSHMSPEFASVFGETIDIVRKLILAEKAQPFIVPGSSSLGWDMMVNLVEEGDEVLVLTTGYFGAHLSQCLEIYGAKVTQLTADIGYLPSNDKIKECVSETAYKLITVTHVDTSTGVLFDIQSLTEMVKSISPETLIVVDGVCSVGVEEIKFDQWNLDVMVTGSQKGLGTPPGLSIVIASQKALKVAQNRKTPIRSYYSNWTKWLPVMQAYEARQAAYFATPAVQLIYALHTSLIKILSQPLEERFKKHRDVAVEFRKDLKEWGLESVPKSESYSTHSMSALWLPEGIQVEDIIASLANKGVQIAGGVLKGYSSKYIRIGHMGISVMEDSRQHVVKVKEALYNSLKELGHHF
ncbi:MAG: pyridoxal phosphate-dependent transferase [Benjaminiella poitrasii]|nr:MAG: pyridoxal phosphate-dependent transferase [Benjaminiella poitrasii]